MSMCRSVEATLKSCTLMDINERHIVQEIKTIANLEHRYNPCNASWGLVLEYCKQLLEGEK